ncbi:hypothetical protein [Methylomonas sp. DH-1]|uniref:hypothetical protein n=2 Tax=Methylomonas sp. (strain DH-1) TaxID=1727196 RepID=UPI0038D448E8
MPVSWQMDVWLAVISGKCMYSLSAVRYGMSNNDPVKDLANVAAAGSFNGARVAVMELVLAEASAYQVCVDFVMSIPGLKRKLTESLMLLWHDGWLLEEVPIMVQGRASRANPFWRECGR